MKYKTLKELRGAFLNGDIDENEVSPMILDNDVVFMCMKNEYEKDSEDNLTIFEACPHTVLKEALEICGLKWEDV